MEASSQDIPAIRDHRRQWRRCLYVYPVISRRSRGLSIGVNLNPDKRCNFNCLYCQIDRHIPRNLKDVDMDVLRQELRQALSAASTGELWSQRRFADTPPALRRLNDIAFSGDGEPTCLPTFDRAVSIAAEAKVQAGRDEVKIVVITNASQFDQPQFRKALGILDANNGEIWAKLDAGSQEYFQRVNRPSPAIPLQRIVDNIASVARDRPVVIQTLFFRIDRLAPPALEVQAYCRRLREILSAGGRIKLVQLHTIARPPAEKAASALPSAELDAIAKCVRLALTDVPVEAYYGADVEPLSAPGE